MADEFKWKFSVGDVVEIVDNNTSYINPYWVGQRGVVEAMLGDHSNMYDRFAYHIALLGGETIFVYGGNLRKIG